MIRQAGSRLMVFVRSLTVVILLVAGIPVVLIGAARARFGGGAPLHGVPSPADWGVDRITSAMTDRLTEHTVADIVIRSSLIIAWAAVVVLVFTIIAETVHMLRHDGLAMPDIRGLGLSQSVARVIAAGLLVVVPMFGTPSRALGGDARRLVPEQRAGAAATVEQLSPATAPPYNVWVVRTPADRADADDNGGSMADDVMAEVTARPGQYVVRAGDSIYGIAERLVGPDRGAIVEYAERLLELNLDNEMPDGRRFTNAALIDVGWVLELPATPGEADRSVDQSAVHVVERGESLWSIAEDHLDDGARWPEIYEANQGRSFDDGRQLVDPDLIQPRWQLDLPVDADPVPVDADDADDDPAADAVVAPAPPDNVWESAGDADVGGSDNRGAGSVTAPADTSAAAGPVWGGVGSTTPSADSGTGELAPVAGAESSASARSSGLDPSTADRESESNRTELLTLTGAAMLSTGVLTLLAVRRRNRLRRARPRARLPEPAERPATTERALRAIDTGDRLSRIDVAVRSAASSLIEQGPRVLAALVNADGDVELRLSGAASLPSPWHGDAEIWQLDGITPIELLAADAGRVGSPCPAMVQLGRDLRGCDVYLDLEAFGAIEVGGPIDQADAIVTAVATTLAGSVLAEVTTLIGLGVADQAFLGHRLHVPVADDQHAFESAREAVGSTAAADLSTFELRSRAGAGEVWEPAVVLVGSGSGAITPPRVRTGLAVVSASPIHGPSSRLAPDGDAWTLLPLGLRLVPIGLWPADVAAIAELVEVGDPVGEVVPAYRSGADYTLIQDESGIVHDESGRPVDGAEPGADVDQLDSDVAPSAPTPSWDLMVRLLGPVEVVSNDGSAVSFERSKTRELVAWLATHRRRSTRSAARTALWELDVRDATFANVVSEARRSLARLVEPPSGEEWVGRTMTDDLPLHDLVCADVDLVEHALDVARLQPPAQAIATLSPAVDLISGMPFEGTSYLWPDPEGITSNLVLLATSAAAELAGHCLSLGDIKGVFHATGRGLTVLPGHEELIGLRMQAHARAGDHAGVRQEWESYERVITSDPWSDGEPSPKLVELRRQLLNPSR